MVGTRMAAGDRAAEQDDAFGRLLAREFASAYRTAAVVLGDAAEAEDATQDALVRAWMSWGQLRDKDRAAAWFGRIVMNICRDRLRARRASNIRPSVDRLVSDPAADTVERDALRAAFDELSPEHKIVVALRYYLDLPIEAIAERTGVPQGTVKSRLHNGLRAMRAAYDAHDRVSEATR
jgi:RNA polymerase sigma-70 factor (ECF subfamily)